MATSGIKDLPVCLLCRTVLLQWRRMHLMEEEGGALLGEKLQADIAGGESADPFDPPPPPPPPLAMGLYDNICMIDF